MIYEEIVTARNLKLDLILTSDGQISLIIKKFKNTVYSMKGL